MPEIASACVLYYDPFDSRDIARALTSLAEDAHLRREPSLKARQQALKFPKWDEVGQLTLRSLERALNGA